MEHDWIERNYKRPGLPGLASFQFCKSCLRTKLECFNGTNGFGVPTLSECDGVAVRQRAPTRSSP